MVDLRDMAKIKTANGAFLSEMSELMTTKERQIAYLKSIIYKLCESKGIHGIDLIAYMRKLDGKLNSLTLPNEPISEIQTTEVEAGDPHDNQND